MKSSYIKMNDKYNFLNKLYPQNLRDFSKFYSHRQFPQSIPYYIWFIKFLCSVAKLSLPLILQEIYQHLQNSQKHEQLTPFYQIGSCIVAMVMFSYGIQLYFQERLIQYRLNIKQILSKRIAINNISDFQKGKQQAIFTTNADQKIKIYTKITSKLPVYIYNYYNSLMALIFQILNITFAIVYLSTKLQYSLIVALIIAFLIMIKIISVTQKMQKYTFDNIALQDKKITYLKCFFKSLVQYKMTFLDKWIHEKISKNQQEYQLNLQGNKMLDCWCVGLWRFTIISISSAIFCTYYFFYSKDINSIDEIKQKVSPSTILYFIMIMTSPLNGLSWNVAGLRNAKKAINQVLSDIRKISQYSVKKQKQKSIQFNLNPEFQRQMQIKENMQIRIQKQNNQKKQQESEESINKNKDSTSSVIIFPASKFKLGSIISIQGQQCFNILKNLPYILKNQIGKQEKIGYAQQNGWFLNNILDSVTLLSQFSQERVSRFLDLFKCENIPLQNSTSTYSGGEKMRISLVRAFLNSKIIVINSDLSSLDKSLKGQILQNIQKLCIQESLLVFIKQNKQYANYIWQFSKNTKSQFNQNFIQGQFTKLECKQMLCEYSKVIDLKAKEKYEQLKKYIFSKRLHDQQTLNKKNNKPQEQSYTLNFQTFKAYYKSYQHLIFFVAIIFVTILQNFYNFYVTNCVSLDTLSKQKVITIVILTLSFGICVIFRSYYFATANLEESKRISKDIDSSVILNKIQFYQNFEIKNSNKNLLSLQKSGPLAKQPNYEQFCSKLIYNSTTDLHQVSDSYPWHANIFFNNVATIISSILMITYQIPIVFIILLPLIVYTFKLNKEYQIKMEKVLQKQKLIEEKLMNHMHRLQNGIKYMYIYGQKIKNIFVQNFQRQLKNSINIQWKLHKLKHNVNLRYRFLMALFLGFIIFFYWSTNFNNLKADSPQNIMHTKNNFQKFVHYKTQQRLNQIDFNKMFKETSTQQSKSSSGSFALLISYTMTLTNFMLFFTVSMGQTLQQAHSIQRIRNFIFLKQKHNQNKQNTIQRLKDFDLKLDKIKKGLNKSLTQNKNQRMIKLEKLDFTYRMNNHKVFEDLNLQIKRGDKILLKGQSGCGKTTLFKLLLSLYKQSVKFDNEKIPVQFSPQHPLILPFTDNIKQNIDPYELVDWKKYSNFNQFLQKLDLPQKINIQLLNCQKPQGLSYESQIVIGNIRAYLYGSQGLKIYDQPYWVGPKKCINQLQTYLIVTHHRQFENNRKLVLKNSKIIQDCSY